MVLNYYSSGQRNKCIDTIKGIAIILVVIGHCIQFGSGANVLESGSFFEDPLFKFIYSFHMPLFMLVSGYLFAYTTKRDTITIIKRKAKSILLPLIIWQTINLGINIILGQSYTYTIFFLSYFHSFWFLRALFFCFMVILLMNRLFNDNIISYIVLFFILHFIPNRVLPNIFVFTIVYFVMGYLFNKKSFPIYYIPKYSKSLFILFTVLFIALLTNFKETYYVYISNTCIFNKLYSPTYMLYIIIYRHLTAIIGCITILLSIHYIYKTICIYIIDILSSLGQASLCIYVIDSIINEQLLPSFPFIQINYIITIAETIIVLLISYLIYTLLKSNWITTYLFLGGR